MSLGEPPVLLLTFGLEAWSAPLRFGTCASCTAARPIQVRPSGIFPPWSDLKSEFFHGL